MNSIQKNSSQNVFISSDIIMTQRLPQYIKFLNNIDINENSKRRIRKSLGLSFKGLKKKEQKNLIIEYATELRSSGRRLKGLRYAYKYLAEVYNDAVEDRRDEILKMRKVRKELEKKLINFKFGKIGKFCINKNIIELLGANTIIEIVANILTGEMVLLSVISDVYSSDGMEWDDDNNTYVAIPETFKKYYTLSQSNINDLINALKNRTEEYTEYSNSDEAFAGDIMTAKQLCIEYPRLDKDKDFYKSGYVKTKKGGAFFRYFNKTDFDLKDYGILNNKLEFEKLHYFRENCLYRALEKGGMFQKLQSLRNYVVNRDVPICKLKDICNKLHICIRLRKDDKTDKAIIYGKGHSEIYEIGLIDRHYFLIEEVDFTMFSLKNYFELKKKYTVEQMKYFYAKRGNSYKKDENRKTDSFKVIKFLINNKEKYLKPITYNNGLLETPFIDRAFEITDLSYNYDCVDCDKNEYDHKKEDYKLSRSREWVKWFFDFESFKMKVINPKIVKEYNTIYNGKFYKNKKRDLRELKKKAYMYIHTPYLCCAVSETGKKIIAYGDNCGKLMLDLIIKATPIRESGEETGKYCKIWNRLDYPRKKALMIAHNCNYDYRFLQKNLYDIKQITKGSGLMNATAKYMRYEKDFKEEAYLQFKDSLKLISMPLKKFGKCFKLKQEKEVFPYGLYTQENIKKNWVEINKAKNFLNTEKFNLFVKNLKRLNLIRNFENKKLFNMMKYAEYYCLMDCRVLKKGYETFRGWVLNELSIDIDTVWTVASLANKYMVQNNVYKGVYQLSGVPQLFIQKCVVGGRTMCRDNKKIIFDNSKKEHKNNKNNKNKKSTIKKMADYDGVSLYPSSMYRMKGCLLGLPKIISEQNKNYEFLKKVDGYFVKILIKDVGIKRHFSLMSEVNKEGVRMFHNDMKGKIMYVDKTSLEDLIEFQEVKFDILMGYYYDEGRNPLIRKVIKQVFDLRLKLKAEKNDAQLVYKLIMNSAYGRTILKPIINKECIVSDKEKDQFITRNYNYIIEYEKLYLGKNWRFKLHKITKNHFNNCVVGVEVLSMSKRIMNEVMCLADDNGLKISYQDTDSLHIDYSDVAILKKKFYEKYKRELDGKQLGQFHIDFDLYDEYGEECKDIYAEKSIFLGKKCYIDCLIGYRYDHKKEKYILDSKGKKIEVRGFHIRMKGIPNSTIKYTAEKMGISLYDLYKNLYDGEKIKFDLLQGGARCNFKFHNNGSVSSMTSFFRELSF